MAHDAPKKKPVNLTLNGTPTAAFADPGQNLLEFLRRGVGDLTPKYGCGQGTCGACTVTIDGETQLSCLVLAETVDGKSVGTAGGLANGRRARPAARRLHGSLRRPVRLLHAGHAGVGPRACWNATRVRRARK
jgi:xanthine dehydrogenase iron-sulfur cluster and FAD-binding subunit A